MLGISFISITQGKRLSSLTNLIRSILHQRAYLENFEIIVVGKLPEDYLEKINNLAKEQNFEFKYFYFIERDDPGWLTGKHNFGAKNAQFDMLFFLHDDLWFDHGFFKHLKTVNPNSFDALGFSRTNVSTGNRPLDWVYYGPEGHFNMCYDLKSEYAYINGGAILVHRKVWEKEKWDETCVFRVDGEDVEYSRRLISKGYNVRCEGKLKIITLWQGIFPLSGNHKTNCSCFK
jgi:GT2 family glycosyltransferase